MCKTSLCHEQWDLSFGKSALETQNKTRERSFLATESVQSPGGEEDHGVGAGQLLAYSGMELEQKMSVLLMCSLYFFT